MRKFINVAMVACCIAILGCGCGAEKTESTQHTHTWTQMENDSERWEECEDCGAKKNIVEVTTEVATTTEATTEAPATTEATTEKKETKKKETKKKGKKRGDYKTDHDYNWYMRNATGGEKFSYTMKVLQTVEDGTLYLCDLGTSYSGNMVFINVDTNSFTKEIKGGKRIIEDDIIRVYGEFQKTYIYETANGGSKEALIVNAAYIDIQ